MAVNDNVPVVEALAKGIVVVKDTRASRLIGAVHTHEVSE